MENKYQPSLILKSVTGLMILTGIVAVIFGFLTDPSRTWSNLLMNNFFFLTISIGAMLFFCLQYITGSDWSAFFQRIPLSMGTFLPFAAIIMLIMYFGLPKVYQWAQPDITQTDYLIAHKAGFLNTPFFMIRIVIYFALWISLAMVLQKLAHKEDIDPNGRYYEKMAFYSKAFVFAVVIFFSFAAIDWLMTIDAHWYSTLFGFRAMVTSIYFAVAAIVLMVFFLRSKGNLRHLNKAHQHDLARYLFRFSIVFGYLWFIQFLIIWYANIPELTMYYNPRFLGEWRYFFYAEIIINFLIPFVLLISNHLGRKKPVLIGVSALLIFGLWISLYLQVMPGSYGIQQIGFLEAGMWLGFAGVFLGLVFLYLSRGPLIPLNHPQLEASIHHHV